VYSQRKHTAYVIAQPAFQQYFCLKPSEDGTLVGYSLYYSYFFFYMMRRGRDDSFLSRQTRLQCVIRKWQLQLQLEFLAEKKQITYDRLSSKVHTDFLACSIVSNQREDRTTAAWRYFWWLRTQICQWLAPKLSHKFWENASKLTKICWVFAHDFFVYGIRKRNSCAVCRYGPIQNSIYSVSQKKIPPRGPDIFSFFFTNGWEFVIDFLNTY